MSIEQELQAAKAKVRELDRILTLEKAYSHKLEIDIEREKASSDRLSQQLFNDLQLIIELVSKLIDRQ